MQDSTIFFQSGKTNLFTSSGSVAQQQELRENHLGYGYNANALSMANRRVSREMGLLIKFAQSAKVGDARRCFSKRVNNAADAVVNRLPPPKTIDIGILLIGV